MSHQLLYRGASIDNMAAATCFWDPLTGLPRPFRASHGLLHCPQLQQMPSITIRMVLCISFPLLLLWLAALLHLL